MPHPEVSHLSEDFFSPSLAAMAIADGTASQDTISKFDDWRRSAPVEEIAVVASSQMTDHLTGLLTRRAAAEFYANDQSLASRLLDADADRPAIRGIFALMVDFEGMKRANTHPACGYHSVDAYLLGPLAQAVKANVRQSDHVSRLGGDEILVEGLAQFGLDEGLPNARDRVARQSLAMLLGTPAYRQHFGLPETGIVARAAIVPPETPWEDLTMYVDPKLGMDPATYDYSRLPEGSVAHRIYLSPQASRFGRICYLAASREGGTAALFDTVEEMGLALTDTWFRPEDADHCVDVSVKDIPAPFSMC